MTYLSVLDETRVVRTVMREMLKIFIMTLYSIVIKQVSKMSLVEILSVWVETECNIMILKDCSLSQGLLCVLVQLGLTYAMYGYFLVHVSALIPKLYILDAY